VCAETEEIYGLYDWNGERYEEKEEKGEEGEEGGEHGRAME
jgi:hypothetical protein